MGSLLPSTATVAHPAFLLTARQLPAEWIPPLVNTSGGQKGSHNPVSGPAFQIVQIIPAYADLRAQGFRPENSMRGRIRPLTMDNALRQSEEHHRMEPANRARPHCCAQRLTAIGGKVGAFRPQQPHESAQRLVAVNGLRTA